MSKIKPLIIILFLIFSTKAEDCINYDSLVRINPDTTFYTMRTNWDIHIGGMSGYELKIYSNKDSASVRKGDSVLFVYDIKKKHFIRSTISYTDAFLIVMEILSKAF